LENFELEKKIWTEIDFKIMGWHDSPIYGISMGGSDPVWKELLLDIDYIFQWVHPVPPDEFFTFWIAPATLVFKNVFNVVINIEAGPSSVFDLEIADIHRLEELVAINGYKYWKWHIELQNGSIFLESNGYEQIIKEEPVFTNGQFVPKSLRGEPNFKRIPF
jgi:hypothetical protein